MDAVTFGAHDRLSPNFP